MPLSSTIAAKLVSCGKPDDVDEADRRPQSRVGATPTDANSIASSSASSSLKSCLKNSDCLKAPERRKVTFDPEFKSNRSPAVQRRYDRRKHGKDEDDSINKSSRRSNRDEHGHGTAENVTRADIHQYQSALSGLESSLASSNNSGPDQYDSSSSARKKETDTRCKRKSDTNNSRHTSSTTHKIVQTSRNIETVDHSSGDKGEWRSRVWAKYAVTPAPPDEQFPLFSPLSGQCYNNIEPNKDIALLNVVNLVSPDVESPPSSYRSARFSSIERDEEKESPPVSFEAGSPANETKAKLHMSKDESSSSFYLSSSDDDSWRSEMSREQLENVLSREEPHSKSDISKIIAASGGCADNLMDNISDEIGQEKHNEVGTNGIVIPNEKTEFQTQEVDDKVKSSSAPIPDGCDAADVPSSPLPGALPLQRGVPSSSSSQISDLTNDFSWILKNEIKRAPSKNNKVSGTFESPCYDKGGKGFTLADSKVYLDDITLQSGEKSGKVGEVMTGNNAENDVERGEGMRWLAEDFDDVFVATERKREEDQMSKQWFKRKRYFRVGVIFLLVALSCIVVGVIVIGSDTSSASGDVSSQVSAPSALSLSSNNPSVAPSSSLIDSPSSPTLPAPTPVTATADPTGSPFWSPTQKPSKQPSNNPVKTPTRLPSQSPTNNPTNTPTMLPSNKPTFSPSSEFPSSVPTPLRWQDEIFFLINDERIKIGAPPLCFNKKLIASAELHALDMAENDFVSLTGSDGSGSTQRARAQGYDRRSIGETVVRGYDNVSEVIEYFLEPGTQRSENLLNSDYVHFGVGRVSDYWSAVFASSKDANEGCTVQ